MKKILGILFALAIAAVLAAPGAKAVTSTSSAQDVITALQAQITTLQNQIKEMNAQAEALKKAQTEVKETVKDVKGTLQILKQLKPGMTSDEVKKLQEIMATDPDIYPEGIISGYYGKLTEKAVKKLQNKFCLDQVGSVGPKTLAKINELLKEGAGNSDHVPAGLLRAPGILKKLCATTTPATTSATGQ